MVLAPTRTPQVWIKTHSPHTREVTLKGTTQDEKIEMWGSCLEGLPLGQAISLTKRSIWLSEERLIKWLTEGWTKETTQWFMHQAFMLQAPEVPSSILQYHCKAKMSGPLGQSNWWKELHLSYLHLKVCNHLPPLSLLKVLTWNNWNSRHLNS